MTKLLVIDDDEAVRFGIQAALRGGSSEVVFADSAATAIAAAKKEAFDAVLLDVGLPDRPGLDVLEELLAIDPFCPVIVFTGRDDAATAVRALHAGAANYLIKPVPRLDLLHAIEQATTRSTMAKRLDAARRQQNLSSHAIGDSEAWRAVHNEILSVAPFARTAVLITGESGTGKEVASSMLHAASPRADGPLVTVNCACIAPSLLESELFGHEAGAFTSARGAKRGLFELASGGTLFLDEVGELPLELQPKLLRVLETQCFRRLGGEREMRVDVRVVSATNRSLDAEVAASRFRRDLYHRLRVVEIHLPPLRDRGDDVELLALHFLSRLGGELGRPIESVDPDVFAAFRAYDWPGNVRELRNVIERGIVLAPRGRFTVEQLPRELQRSATDSGRRPKPLAKAPFRAAALDDVVKEHVLRSFELTEGNLAQTARSLGISRVALRRRLRAYGVKPPSGDD